MDILFVTSGNIFSTSSSNLRNVSLIQGLIEIGHKVDVWSLEAGSSGKIYDESIKNIVSRNKVFLSSNNSLQKFFSEKKVAKENFVNKMKFKLLGVAKKMVLKYSLIDTLMPAVAKISKDEIPTEEYDIIISSSDPISSHEMALMYKKLHSKAKWIQYWGDPLYYDITRNFSNKRKAFKVEEKYLLACDVVVYTNPIVLEAQKKLFLNAADKMHFVPTPFAFSDNSASESESEGFDIGYFGNYLSCVRNIEPLCHAVMELRKKIVIMGRGDKKPPVSEYIDVYDSQSIVTVSEFEDKCKILVCLCNDNTKKDQCLQIPGKVYHYAMTEKDILIIGADKNTEKFLSGYSRYYFCANNVEAIKDAINKIEKNEGKVISKPIEAFRPKNVANKVIEYLSILGIN